ncbi:MAG: glycosyltransferase [Nitrospira sp.]|nr:glycosyltransferase [Nitrospira sp.]
MKIAQIAPLWNRLPSDGLSDAERTVSYLIDELVRRGHAVTLFASADARTSAKLEPFGAAPFSQGPANWGRASAAVLVLEQVFGPRAHEFDIIHSHFGVDGFPLAQPCATPTLATVVERLDAPEYSAAFTPFQDLPLVSTSHAQRRPLAWAPWEQTIYPGVPAELYRFHPWPGQYLAFIGSLSMDGGLGLAIEIARRAHLLLRVASRQDHTDAFPLSIPMELLSAGNGVEWVGALTEEETHDFLGNALALVCAQDGPHASGLCVAEALACGTPVLAFHGSPAAEMIYDHVTGFACESLEEMIEMVPLIGDIDRRECRGAFEKRLSAERMTDQYLDLYARLTGAAPSHREDGAAGRMAQADRRPVAVAD